MLAALAGSLWRSRLKPIAGGGQAKTPGHLPRSEPCAASHGGALGRVMRFRRWMVYLGVPVIAIAVIAYLFTWRWFIPILEQQASTALGRNVAIKALDVRLGRTTEVTLRGVRVDNPEGFQADRPFAQLEALVALVDVVAYWNERAIVIPSITIDGADVQAIAASKESNNFTFALGGPSGEGAAADPSSGPAPSCRPICACPACCNGLPERSAFITYTT
jgi:hypothetical protein